MKLLNISLLSLSVLIAMPASAIFNPLAWFKAKTSPETDRKQCADMLKDIAEKLKPNREQAKRDTGLLFLSLQPDFVKNSEKLYNNINVKPEYTHVRDCEKIAKIFRKAQSRWGVRPSEYKVNPSEFREQFLNALNRNQDEQLNLHKPALLEAWHNAFWYEKLKRKEERLSESERNKSAAEREIEFDAWKEEKNRTRLGLSKESMDLLEKLPQAKLARLYHISDALDEFKQINTIYGNSPLDENPALYQLRKSYLKKLKNCGLPTTGNHKWWKYKENLIPALEQAEKEANAAPQPARVSWYEKLERMHIDMPEDEYKSSEERKNEFEKWKTEKNRTRLALSQESMDLLAKQTHAKI